MIVSFCYHVIHNRRLLGHHLKLHAPMDDHPVQLHSRLIQQGDHHLQNLARPSQVDLEMKINLHDQLGRLHFRLSNQMDLTKLDDHPLLLHFLQLHQRDHARLRPIDLGMESHLGNQLGRLRFRLMHQKDLTNPHPAQRPLPHIPVDQRTKQITILFLVLFGTIPPETTQF